MKNVPEFSNGRCFGNRCIHYSFHRGSRGGCFSTCDVLSDASEVRTVDHLVDNFELCPCDKFEEDDCIE